MVIKMSQPVVGELLYDFEVNGVNALVIMEKEDLQIIMGKGISASALVNFVVDLFLREPELYQATMETVQAIMMETMEDVRKRKTNH